MAKRLQNMFSLQTPHESMKESLTIFFIRNKLYLFFCNLNAFWVFVRGHTMIGNTDKNLCKSSPLCAASRWCRKLQHKWCCSFSILANLHFSKCLFFSPSLVTGGSSFFSTLILWRGVINTVNVKDFRHEPLLSLNFSVKLLNLLITIFSICGVTLVLT